MSNYGRDNTLTCFVYPETYLTVSSLPDSLYNPYPTSIQSLLTRKVNQQKPPAVMKSVAVIVLALACVIGLAVGQGYGGLGAPQPGGFGNGGLLALIGLLVLLFALFGNNTSSTSGDTTLIFGNFSGPTGGK